MMSDAAERPLRVEDVLRVIFKREGITFKTAHLLRRKIVDDHIISQTLEGIEAFAERFEDGTYEIAIEEATVSGVGKAAVEIPWMHVEVAFVGGAWSEPRIYHDEETIVPGEDEAQALFARLQRIKEKLLPILDTITVLVKVADALRRFFS